MESEVTKVVIIGGGIAGVNCAATLLENNHETSSKFQVFLITASSFVKTVTNWHKIGQFIENFEIEEAHEIFQQDSRFHLIYDQVIGWDSSKKILYLKSNESIEYSKLCIATGATAKCPFRNVQIIRDTDTVAQFQNNLRNSRHITIVGNGGIATELVYELQNVQISWLIRDSFISSSFFPSDVESFIIPKLLEGRKKDTSKIEYPLTRKRFTTSQTISADNVTGVALGPDWCTVAQLSGSHKHQHSVNIIRNCQISNVSIDKNTRIIEYVDEKKNIQKLECDLILWATGVIPNIYPWSTDENLKISPNDCGIIVNDIFETSIPDVYACGDVCTIENPNKDEKWKQMRLWTQARQTSELCARSILFGSDSRIFNIYLDMFTHCTSFFGLKVVFLGDYKPENQKNGNWRIVERTIGDDEYVRSVLVDHKVVGAILIGETNLEETMENMIMNGTNLEGIEETFLDPGVEIDDFFD